jgi:carbohydrate kinase (thermoresistant glucokinase family)
MNRYIIFIMGVAGSGKTTIGKMVAAQTGIPFFDADTYHPAANLAKMKSGQALTDEDREPWLEKLNELALSAAVDNGAVIACSALKENYRNTLSIGLTNPVWIYLQGSYELVWQRMQERKDHFMPATLLRSQFDTLEVPVNAMVIDIDRTPEQITQEILNYISLL